jgi:cytochrome oxidase assembly protein ShyY1
MTAANSAADPAGLSTALRWFSFGFPLAVLYFVVLFRLHRGKVTASPEGEGY